MDHKGSLELFLKFHLSRPEEIFQPLLLAIELLQSEVDYFHFLGLALFWK